jgi:hypothetical protein
MKKISGTVVFQKRIFPVIWLGFLAMFVTSGLRDGRFGDAERWPFIVMPILMAVFGFVLFKKLVWDLMDEVHDCGDSLRVRRGGDEETIPLANIMNVSASTMVNPQRITLRLVTPGRFGNEITFAPPARFSLNPFIPHPIVDELIVRVDRARSQRRA